MELDEVNLNELYLVEYSPSQKAYNIDKFENILMQNIKNIMNNNIVDYFVIGYGKTLKEAQELADLFLEKMGRP